MFDMLRYLFAVAELHPHVAEYVARLPPAPAVRVDALRGCRHCLPAPKPDEGAHVSSAGAVTADVDMARVCRVS